MLLKFYLLVEPVSGSPDLPHERVRVLPMVYNQMDPSACNL